MKALKVRHLLDDLGDGVRAGGAVDIPDGGWWRGSGCPQLVDDLIRSMPERRGDGDKLAVASDWEGQPPALPVR